MKLELHLWDSPSLKRSSKSDSPKYMMSIPGQRDGSACGPVRQGTWIGTYSR